MKINKLSDDTYEIWERPIRGYDWQLIRKKGTGTYARIAGPNEDDDDEMIIIEEYSDDENRRIWDNMSLLDIISAVYREVKDIIGENP